MKIVITCSIILLLSVVVPAVCSFKTGRRKRGVVTVGSAVKLEKMEGGDDGCEDDGCVAGAQAPLDPDKDLYGKILSYMESEQPFLNDDFCLDDLARDVFSNKAYVSRAINDKAGVNFRQFVNRYRVDYAKSLIEKDLRLKVVELSIMSGFHSVASFNSSFRLHAGTTPSEYIRDRQAERFLSQ